MKYAQMVCAASQNIGDDIQSIAAAAHLPQVDLHLDRDRLDAVEGTGPVGLIMNAWFLDGDGWPPAETIRPIFVGFHVADRSRHLIAKHAQYLKRYEPIGVRDKSTAEFVTSLGVAAEVTYCMTLTLPPRARAPAHGKVIIVDADDIAVPRTLERQAMRLTHVVPLLRDQTKLQYARELLDYYRDHASLVVTTRLHCALPCLAMGIPVVFFGSPSNYPRTRTVADIGGIIHKRQDNKKGLTLRGALGKVLGAVDWSPKPIDVSAIRARLLQAVSVRMEATRSAEAGV